MRGNESDLWNREIPVLQAVVGGQAVIYEYEFAVWPDETSPRWNRAVYDVWRAGRLHGIIVMEFAEREFNDFREELAKCGLTLREIARRPHVEAEPVL